MKLDAKQGEQKLEVDGRATTPRPRPAYAKASARCSDQPATSRRGEVPGPDRQHPLGLRQKTRRVTNWKNGAMAFWVLVRGDREELPEDHRLRPALELRAHLDDHEPAEMRKAGQGDSPEPPPSTVSGTPSKRGSWIRGEIGDRSIISRFGPGPVHGRAGGWRSTGGRSPARRRRWEGTSAAV